MASSSDVMITGTTEGFSLDGSTSSSGNDQDFGSIPSFDVRAWYKWAMLHVYVMMVIGLILNSLTMTAYVKSSILQRGKPAQHLIFNIMISDLLTTVAGQPFIVFYYTEAGEEYVHNKKYLCIFAVCIMLLSFESTYSAILLLTYERLFAIASPLQHMHKVTKKTCRIAIIATWLFLAIKLFMIFIWNVWSPQKKCVPLSIMYPWYMTVFQNFTTYGTFGLIIIGNSILGCLVFASKDTRAALKGDGNPKSKLLRELKMVRMLFIVVLVLFLTWAPVNVSGNIVVTQAKQGNLNTNLLIFWHMSRGWVVAGTVADPLIYIWQNQQCLQAIKKLLGLKDALGREAPSMLSIKSISK